MTHKQFAKIYKMKSGKTKRLKDAEVDVRNFIDALIEIFQDKNVNSLTFNNFGKFYTEEVNRTYVHPITNRKVSTKKRVLKFKPNLAIIENKGIEE